MCKYPQHICKTMDPLLKKSLDVCPVHLENVLFEWRWKNPNNMQGPDLLAQSTLGEIWPYLSVREKQGLL
jgi:hypothetical protein